MPATAEALPERAPNVGDLVQVRSRHWLVEHVTPAPGPSDSARVQLACADDDAQGQTLGVFWDCEPDRRIYDGTIVYIGRTHRDLDERVQEQRLNCRR